MSSFHRKKTQAAKMCSRLCIPQSLDYDKMLLLALGNSDRDTRSCTTKVSSVRDGVIIKSHSPQHSSDRSGNMGLHLM